MKYLLAIDFLSLLLFAFFYPVLPPEIPLYYSRGAVEEQLAPLIFLFLPIFFANLFVVLNNFLIASFFSDKDPFQKLLHYTSYFLITAAFYMFIKTILLVV